METTPPVYFVGLHIYNQILFVYTNKMMEFSLVLFVLAAVILSLFMTFHSISCWWPSLKSLWNDFALLRTQELDPNHKMQFRVMSGHSFCGGRRFYSLLGNSTIIDMSFVLWLKKQNWWVEFKFYQRLFTISSH